MNWRSEAVPLPPTRLKSRLGSQYFSPWGRGCLVLGFDNVWLIGVVLKQPVRQPAQRCLGFGFAESGEATDQGRVDFLFQVVSGRLATRNVHDTWVGLGGSTTMFEINDQDMGRGGH